MNVKDICRTVILVLFSSGIAPVSLAFTTIQDCDVSSDVEFFDLTAYQVEAYVPSVDEEGNTYLKGAELENAKTNHYRNQYSKANVVKLTMDRYASLTANSPEAFKNFESKLIIVEPECNEL